MVQHERVVQLLLVEDEPTHAILMTSKLEELGVTVEHARTRAGAIAALSRARFDLVILDMSLPDGTGEEIQAWLRDTRDPPALVFVTSDDLAEHAVEAVQRGAIDYVVKRPDYLDRMHEVVHRFLSERLPRELESSPRGAFQREQRADLLGALNAHRWNVSATARSLGVSRGKLRGRMRALGLE